MAKFASGSWSSPESQLSASDFCRVCLIDTNAKGAEKVKAKCKLPVRSTPGGPVNKAALRNAAGRIFQTKGVSADAKRKAASRLVSLMRSAGIEVSSDALLRLAGRRAK